MSGFGSRFMPTVHGGLLSYAMQNPMFRLCKFCLCPNLRRQCVNPTLLRTVPESVPCVLAATARAWLAFEDLNEDGSGIIWPRAQRDIGDSRSVPRHSEWQRAQLEVHLRMPLCDLIRGRAWH